MPAILNPLHPTPVGIGGHPAMSSYILMHASAQDKELLGHIYELLHLLFVRNRNQHRRNHWFKSLQQFRKQLGLLIAEMGSDRKVEEKLNARLQFLDDRCIHQWYLHFTQVVAVGPFAVLGLVLMACTARVCRIAGITALYEEIASEDLKTVLRLMDAGEVETISGLLSADDEDEGEVIARDE
ncbi:hypothetical protein BU24DRAFT_257188 [Aaosphaeria arxii CBS 175.79]|uniref:RNase MRP protein 1 RNA binding domain-containing protein n=1 Tax=Aaosphaeria arxii CBS 175.79 TaxID=1450172 RepID=A0A6A5XIN4_9PLEO|nr:uncharacterized protein BU24DRAFT_257188 [Aaosphaeria arxii CBS 175.79]KAF2012687.1 hypothetical protein BU24DRAFT_257188 [Aaosphaeria arxii CBS 175.79]